jgi:hypothetical protein
MDYLLYSLFSFTEYRSELRFTYKQLQSVDLSNFAFPVFRCADFAP